MLQLLLVLVILSLCLHPYEECDLLSTLTLFVHYVMPSAKRAKEDFPLPLSSRLWNKSKQQREETKIRKPIYNLAKDIRTTIKSPHIIIITTTTAAAAATITIIPYKSQTLKYLQTKQKKKSQNKDKFKFMKNLMIFYLHLLRAK